VPSFDSAVAMQVGKQSFVCAMRVLLHADVFVLFCMGQMYICAIKCPALTVQWRCRCASCKTVLRSYHTCVPLHTMMCICCFGSEV
jgi:hypothetical protein